MGWMAAPRASVKANCSLISMVTAPSRHDDGGMTYVENYRTAKKHRTEQREARRPRGFARELLYLIVVAVIFNATALAAVAVASGLAAPVQVVIGLAVLAMLVAAFSAAVRGLRFFG